MKSFPSSDRACRRFSFPIQNAEKSQKAKICLIAVDAMDLNNWDGRKLKGYREVLLSKFQVRFNVELKKIGYTLSAGTYVALSWFKI